MKELLAENGKLLFAICDSAQTDTYDQLALALLMSFEHQSVQAVFRLLKTALTREIEKTSKS